MRTELRLLGDGVEADTEDDERYRGERDETLHGRLLVIGTAGGGCGGMIARLTPCATLRGRPCTRASRRNS